MEKTARRQQIIKWQLILGAVVCAIVAFCVLPGSVIAADAKTEIVEYVDRVWNETTKQVDEIPSTHECEVLTKKMCKKGLTSGWYVLNKNITVRCSYIHISGNVNIILKDKCTLDNDYQGGGKRGIILNDGANLTIYEEKQTYDKGNPNPKGKIKVDGGTLHEDAGIGVPLGTTLNIKGGTIEASGTEGGAGIGGLEDGPAGETNIYGGTVTATGSNDGAGIGGGEFGANDDFYGYWGGQTNIYGGTVTANGGYGAAGIGGGRGADLFLKTFVGGRGGATFIYGGTVTANGGYGAAGIGGGKGADGGEGGDTFIYGGTVTANGGSGAAGIGGGRARGLIDSSEGGYGGHVGSVGIYGGTVTANGGSGAAGIGKGCSVGVRDNGWSFWDYIEIVGGTVTANGGYGAAGIDDCDGQLVIEGGNIKGENIKGKNLEGTDLIKHTITLDGVTEEVEVVGVNCNYGVEDVYTLDKGKLYFYMTEDEYEKFTEITVRYKDGQPQTYSKNDSDVFVLKPLKIDIKGVTAQNEVYDGFPKQGYTGTPENGYGYYGEYTTTYYLSTGEITTPENSGAEGTGMAPVYVGDYIVRITVPLEESVYFGYTELDFKVEKATPEIVEAPILSGVYGTVVKDMVISDGFVMVGNIYEPGIWTVTDERGTDIPEVGATESYEVTFTPKDTRNYNSVTTKVVPKVIEIPTQSKPTAVADSGKTNREKLIDKLKEKLSNPEVKAKLSEPEVRNNIKEKLLNDELIKAYKTKDNLKELFSNNPELRDKVRDKITNSELIEDEEVREKLLSFIEE